MYLPIPRAQWRACPGNFSLSWIWDSTRTSSLPTTQKLPFASWEFSDFLASATSLTSGWLCHYEGSCPSMCLCICWAPMKKTLYLSQLIHTSQYCLCLQQEGQTWEVQLLVQGHQVNKLSVQGIATNNRFLMTTLFSTALLLVLCGKVNFIYMVQLSSN